MAKRGRTNRWWDDKQKKKRESGERFYVREKRFLFGDRSARWMLNKLKRELARLEDRTVVDNDEKLDHMFNALVTAWSLIDWVHAENAYVNRGTWPYRDDDEFQREIVGTCAMYRLIAKPANALKHRSMTLQYTLGSQEVVTYASVVPGTVRVGVFEPEYRILPLDVAASAWIHSDGSWRVPKFLSQGQRTRVADALRKIIKFWEDRPDYFPRP